MILTNEEVDAIRKSLPAVCSHQQTIRAAEAAIIAKIGKPACWVTPDGEGWRMRLELPVNDVPLGWTPLYAIKEAK